MEKLRQLKEEFKKLVLLGCNQYESAQCAVDEVFKDVSSSPYIYKDECGDPSHIFYSDYVLFFDEGIYGRLL